jgi:hypothetical protein
LTYFLDEFDQYAEDEDKALYQVLNAGYSRMGDIVERQKPAKDGGYITESFHVFGPIAFATLNQKGIREPLRRRSIVLSNDKVESGVLDYDLRDEQNALDDFRVRFSQSKAIFTQKMVPVMPDQIKGRRRDIWKQLVCIAEHAGDPWPYLVRKVALNHEELLHKSTEETIECRVLRYSQLAWEKVIKPFSQGMSRDTLYDAMRDVADGRGDKIAKDLYESYGKILRSFDIPAPVPVRIGKLVSRGYRLVDLAPVWDRHVRPEPEPEEV